MASVTIRDVPESTRDELAARAKRSGRSLQEFLLAQLVDLAARPDAADHLARIRQRKRDTDSRLSPAQILEYRDADRR